MDFDPPKKSAICSFTNSCIPTQNNNSNKLAHFDYFFLPGLTGCRVSPAPGRQRRRPAAGHQQALLRRGRGDRHPDPPPLRRPEEMRAGTGGGVHTLLTS